MTAAKYAIGVHNYEPNNAPVNEYTAGELASYQTALGVSLAGAVAHAKLKDSANRWQGGVVPGGAGGGQWGTNDHNNTFMTEAKALGMVTFGAWMPEESSNKPWDYLDDAGAMANFDAAAAECVSVYPDVDIWLFGNEREGHDLDNSAAQVNDWFTLENRAGQIWQGLGKQWATGADQSIANQLSSITSRLALYDSTPDHWVVHAYGNGGFTSRNVRDVRRSFEALLGYRPSLIYGEWAIDFENLTGYDTKDWVRDYRARQFNEHVGRALRRERCYGCAFNLKELMNVTVDFPDYEARQGLIDALSDAETATNPPSRLPTSAAAVTRRYLIEGVMKGNEWGAVWQGAKEYGRSIASYPGYWS